MTLRRVLVARTGASFDSETPISLTPHLTFSVWYEATWPGLVRYLTAELGAYGTAAPDLAAEAMLRAYQRWDKAVIREPTPWVYQVGGNLARRYARRRSLEERFYSRAESNVSSQAEIEHDPQLLSALVRLPPRQRTAIALRYYADLTQAQVAEIMNVQPGTVAALLHKARAALRRELITTDDPRE